MRHSIFSSCLIVELRYCLFSHDLRRPLWTPFWLSGSLTRVQNCDPFKNVARCVHYSTKKVSIRLLCTVCGVITEGGFHFAWDCTQDWYWGHFIVALVSLSLSLSHACCVLLVASTETQFRLFCTLQTPDDQMHGALVTSHCDLNLCSKMGQVYYCCACASARYSPPAAIPPTFETDTSYALT
jgi:hypothetical protein